MHCNGVQHFQGSLKSEDIIDRKAPLQNPISSSDHSAAATTSAFSEPENILSNSIENYKTSQELSTSLRPIMRFNSSSNLTGFLAASLFRVGLVAVLFIGFASIWRCVKL